MLSRRQQVSLLLPLVIVVVPFLVLPALLSFVASFTNYTPFQKNLQFVGIHQYVRLLQDDTFRTALGNTLVLTGATVVIEMLYGLVLAYALRRPFRGRMMVRLVLLLPWLVSPAASGVMWHSLMNEQNGILNYWPAILGLPQLQSPVGTQSAFVALAAVEIWRKAPLVTFLLLPGLLSIPAENWEQARLDGLNLAGTIRHVVVSALRPLVLTITLLMAGEALGVAESVFFLTGGGPGTRTMTVGLYSYKLAAQTNNWARAATSGWFIVTGVAIIGIVYLYWMRHED